MTISTETPSTEQVAGETRAVDPVRAYLTGDPEAAARALAPAGRPITQAYMLQQLNGLLNDAVLADPDFSLHRRAVMGPAGIARLESTPMSEPVAAAVWALAGDGGDHLTPLSTTERLTALALSTAARGIAVWGPDGTLQRLDRAHALVSQPH